MGENKAEMFVGIDVSKDSLDVGIRPEGKHWRIANNEQEIPGLVETLREVAPALIVVEATGGGCRSWLWRRWWQRVCR